MGILNLTPDSFFAGSRVQEENLLLKTAEKMLAEGAAILDIGGVSTQPGAAEVSESEEKQRVLPAINQVKKEFPEAILSIDTFRAEVARDAVAAGASIVNDISAGRFDRKMYPTLAKLQVPYILTHSKGTPQTMTQAAVYQNVVQEILDFFIAEVGKLRELGVADILLDPGFGFAKNIAHNFEILKNMHVFRLLDLPVLAGISRKSMIWKTLKTSPDEALVGTAALHMVALQQGARVLRAHDVRAAREVIELFKQIQ